MRVTSPYNGIHYKAGDNYVVCDECGIVFRASEMVRRWDGFLVCRKDYEERHPQEFVRGIADKVAANKVRIETYVPLIQDYCIAVTNWTVGSGWELNSELYGFKHTSGSDALSRSLSGLTDDAAYTIFVESDEANQGSVTISFTNAAETGAITLNGQTQLNFTAAAVTDNVIFTPSTDFDGKINSIHIYPARDAITQGDL